MFTAQPAVNTNTSAGAPIAFDVSVEDAANNVVTSDNTTNVTLSLGNNPGAATLTCTSGRGTGPVSVVSGVAHFTCSLDKPGHGYTLSAADPTGGTGHPYTSATSAAFNVTAGAAAQLVFTTQPTSTTAGSAVAPAVQVAVQDSLGNLVTSDNTTAVTVAIGANPGASTLSGTLTQTVSGGVATFANLSLNHAATGYTLTATSSPAHGSATSAAFNVTAGAAAQLVFTTQPTSTTAGSAVAPAVQVAVQDSLGNLVTSDNTTAVTVAIGANPGASTLSGTLTQTVSGGVATFANLSLNHAATGYTLTATSSPAHGSATSAAFNVTAGAAAQLVFTTQPTSTTAGSAVAPAVQVAVQDSLGNLVTSDNTTAVTVAIGANPGASTLSGTLTQTVSGGVATFANLSLNHAATGYTLTATSSPAHGSATSAAFNVTAGAAAQLVFTTQPTSTTAGSAVAPAVQVAVQDSLGNLVTSDNTTAVTVAIGANPGASTLSGTLTQTVSGGVATFANLSLNHAATGYTLTATDSTAAGGGHPYTAATSSTFNISAPPIVGATLLTTNSGSPCTSGGSCTSAPITPTAGATLLILVHRGGSTSSSDSVTSITGPLTGPTSVASLEYPTALGRNYLFAWTATATGSSGTLTVNFAGGSNANPTVIDVVQLSGNNTASTVAQAPTASGTSLLLGSASANLTTPNTSNGEFVIASFLANAAITTPPGFTAVDSMATGSNGGEDYGVYFNSSAQASTSITAPGLGLFTGWGTIALEINHG